MQPVAELTTGKILRGASDHDLAIAITAPHGKASARPPLTLAIVIDRSGSMSGEPMENAKRAASQLIGQLEASYAFTVVTYSSSDQVVMPMSRASDANKGAARAAIARIYDDGGTCISCAVPLHTTRTGRSRSISTSFRYRIAWEMPVPSMRIVLVSRSMAALARA